MNVIQGAALHVAPKDCIVVEDAQAGLAAARAAGMRSIGVAGTYASAELTDATVTIAKLAAIGVIDSGPHDPLTVHFVPA